VHDELEDSMLDPIAVATAATPFLLKAVEALGEKVWDKTSEAAADETVGFGRRLLARLLGRQQDSGDEAGVESGSDVEVFTGTGSQLVVVEAVKDLVADPGDQDVQSALRLAVRKLLAADPPLMAEVSEFLQKQAPKQQAGERAIQSIGNQRDVANVTGDHNKTKISHGGPGPGNIGA
jgi:hypothetical protein